MNQTSGLFQTLDEEDLGDKIDDNNQFSVLTDRLNKLISLIDLNTQELIKLRAENAGLQLSTEEKEKIIENNKLIKEKDALQEEIDELK